MDDIVRYVTLISSALGALVSMVTLYQLRLYIGKEISKGVRSIEEKL